jgi:colicin import membrane protein
MMTRPSPDTSVIFSLSELADIEEERVREEETQRARARDERAREERKLDEQRRLEEAARVAAEAEARAARLRADAETEARQQAREKAAVEVARIEAEAKARLAADNAVRAHELEVLKLKSERGGRRARFALAAMIGLVACGGSAAAYAVGNRIDRVETESRSLREAASSLRREHEQAMALTIATLDNRHEALRARAGADDDTAASARRAIDSLGADATKVRALADALDAWQARLDRRSRFELLEHRRADLEAWAQKQRRAEALAEVRAAAAAAKGDAAGDAELRAYEGALDEARVALAGETAGTRVRTSDREPTPTPGVCKNPKDPLCADGKILGSP